MIYMKSFKRRLLLCRCFGIIKVVKRTFFKHLWLFPPPSLAPQTRNTHKFSTSEPILSFSEPVQDFCIARGLLLCSNLTDYVFFSSVSWKRRGVSKRRRKSVTGRRRSCGKRGSGSSRRGRLRNIRRNSIGGVRRRSEGFAGRCLIVCKKNMRVLVRC